MGRRHFALLALLCLVCDVAAFLQGAPPPARALIRMSSEEQRKLARPPDPAKLQTDSERRRNRPLSKLKRKKKPDKVSSVFQGGELRPLVAKRDRESVLRGEDFWIPFEDIDKANKAEAEARKPALTEDQFKADKLKAEIVSPYKQNWVLVSCFIVLAIVGFVQLNPGVLDTFPTIGYPEDL